MAEKTCVVCGSPFPARHNEKTCSPECSAANTLRLWREKARRRRGDPEKNARDMAGRRADHTRKTRIRESRKVARGVRHCILPDCRKPFRPRARKITCSPACRVRWKRQRRYAKNHPPGERRGKGVKCPECGVLCCPLGRGRKQCCSPECSEKHWKKWQARHLKKTVARHLQRKYGGGRKCKHCKVPYCPLRPRKGSKGMQFCTPECRRQHLKKYQRAARAVKRGIGWQPVVTKLLKVEAQP